MILVYSLMSGAQRHTVRSSTDLRAGGHGHISKTTTKDLEKRKINKLSMRRTAGQFCALRVSGPSGEGEGHFHKIQKNAFFQFMLEVFNVKFPKKGGTCKNV